MLARPTYPCDWLDFIRVFSPRRPSCCEIFLRSLNWIWVGFRPVSIGWMKLPVLDNVNACEYASSYAKLARKQTDPGPDSNSLAKFTLSFNKDMRWLLFRSSWCFLSLHILTVLLLFYKTPLGQNAELDSSSPYYVVSSVLHCWLPAVALTHRFLGFSVSKLTV